MISRARNRTEEKQILGVTCGSGLTAKQTEKGGSDFLLVLNSAIYRQRGRSSMCGFLPVDNANELTLQVGKREILPIIKKIPVFIGICATDPTIELEKTLIEIKKAGFAGVCNYPTVGLIDGHLAEAIAESPYSFDKEVEMMRIAKSIGLSSIGFIFSKDQANKMIEANVDILCIHLGLTKGGLVGAKKALSLADSKNKINNILDNMKDTDAYKMFFGGSIQTPIDIEYIYNNAEVDGYIAGSSIDRIPSEEFIVKTTEKFKNIREEQQEELLKQMLIGVDEFYDPIEFVKKYVSVNYMNEISFKDISQVVHISRSHLSTLFSKNVGVSFQEYLINYRMNKAAHLIKNSNLKFQEIATLVGYEQYAHFSKMFKTKIGKTPVDYRKSNKKSI